MTKIHVLADETLGGIKREYVEVDRKAEVGEKIVIVEKADDDDWYESGAIFTVDRAHPGNAYVESDEAGSGTNLSGFIIREEYHVLEPTDIVHIGTQRYELTDRKAEVGEMVIYNGNIATVKSVSGGFVKVEDYEDAKGDVIGGFSHGLYRVLVPVEAESDEPQPADPIDVIASLAQEVAEMKRKVSDQQRMLDVLQRRQVLDNIQSLKREQARHRDEIDTLHKDNRTLGEELARLKESATGVKGEKLFTADELAAIIERLLMRP